MCKRAELDMLSMSLSGFKCKKEQLTCSTILLHCVPLPAAGAPAIITFSWFGWDSTCSRDSLSKHAASLTGEAGILGWAAQLVQHDSLLQHGRHGCLSTLSAGAVCC